MATSHLSVSASPLTATPSSPFPRHCGPYALLISAQLRPPPVVCKRWSLVHQSLFGLRRTCHLTRNDPSSERFYGFRIKAEPPSGSSGMAEDGKKKDKVEEEVEKKGEVGEEVQKKDKVEEEVQKKDKVEEEVEKKGKVGEEVQKKDKVEEEVQKKDKVEKKDKVGEEVQKKDKVEEEVEKKDKVEKKDMVEEKVKKKDKVEEEEKKKEEKKKKQVFDTEEKLAVRLAEYVADLSEKCIKERGFFNVVVSGGSLVHFLRKLLEPPYNKTVEWSKWRVFWVDERVLPRDHVDSNYKVAYDNFLSRVPILLRNVYAINDSVLDEGAADDYEGRLKRLVHTRAIETSPETECPKFDLMLLGMGPDGHVGSLFPGHAVLNENKRWVAYMDNSPKEPSKRITMTIPVINACDHVALVVCGGPQADAVAKGWAETDTALLPAQKISPEKEFLWFLDKDAASKLEKTANQSYPIN